MKNIIHLSHTDIRYDSRIIKEMLALSKAYPSYRIQGLGIELSENEDLKASETSKSLEILSFNLKAKKIRFIPKPIRHACTMIEFFLKVLTEKRRLKKPDIIHCHDVIPLPICLYFKFFFKTKIIYDAHELESDRAGLGKAMGKAILSLEKFAWRWLDGFITVSPEIQKWYMSNIGTKHSDVILNSPMLDFKNNIRDEIESGYLKNYFKLNKEDIVFVYIGMLTEGRGIEVLTKVFEELEGSKYHLVFLGHGTLQNSLIKKSKDYNNIHLHEAVAHEKVVELVSSADYGLCMLENVSLSDYLCLPNKLFEYSFARLKVISSNFPAIEKFLKKYDCGMCCENNVKSIKKSLTNLESVEKISKDNFSRLVMDCSWSSQEKKLISMYNSLFNI